MTTNPGELMIGPLTATEWASFALPGDDPRNPLPSCCGNISEVRDEILHVLRAGGDPELFWRSIASVWDLVEDHFGTVDEPEEPWPLTLRKLYEAYVAGRERPDRDVAVAHLYARKGPEVQMFLDAAREGWDLESREGRLRCLARIGGDFVAFLIDPDERYVMADRLAELLGMDDIDVCTTVDTLRLSKGLPYEPTHPDVRNP